MKQITYSKSAFKALRKMPRNEAKRIVGKIEQYADNPASLANTAKALAGSELIRLRVGDWRIIMEDGVVLNILKIAARGSAYEGV